MNPLAEFCLRFRGITLTLISSPLHALAVCQSSKSFKMEITHKCAQVVALDFLYAR